MRRVVASGWFILGPEVEAFEAEFAAACGAAHARRRRHGHRCHHADAARAGHRAGRRGDHLAAVGGVFRAGDHDGRCAAGVRRHRARPADARSARGGCGRHVAHARDPTGAPVRAGRRHDRDSKPSPPATSWRSSRMRARRISPPPTGVRSARSASPARSAFIRPRISARLATAARSSLATRNWRSASSGCATADRRRAITIRRPAPTAGSTSCRRRSCARACRSCAAGPSGAGRLRRGTATSLTGARFVVPARARPRARLSPVSGALLERDALQQHLAHRGVETLIHYPVPIPRQPALAEQRTGRMSGRRSRLRRGAVAAVVSIAPGRFSDACRRCGRRVFGLIETVTHANSHHRRRRLHRLASRGGAARRGPRGVRARRFVDRRDRQHRASQGPARLSLHDRYRVQRFAGRRAWSIART